MTERHCASERTRGAQEEVGVTPGLFCLCHLTAQTKEIAMSRNSYSVGDTVVLKSDLMRTLAADRRCRIVGILPAA